MRRTRLTYWRAGLAASTCLALSGCNSLGYYAQAAHGQFSLLAQARPITEWLQDPATSPRLHSQLELVQNIRQFSIRTLALPDNGSYRSYAQLTRPFVVWNVVAAPALSLDARQWCFPIAGCVNYRGYYDQKEAQAYADGLAQAGDDVQVLGVPAYSTLGWFNDPVLSTFINYPAGEVARLIFHELAHQVAYAKDDSQFNESFATAVEELGLERWLAAHGDPALNQAYQRFAERKKEFLALLLKYRAQLQANYQGAGSDQEKLRRKAEIFAALRSEYQERKAVWGGFAGYDRWFAGTLSNAHLALVATYNERVPAFKALFARSRDFSDFYRQVKVLAKQSKEARSAALDDLQ
ncbi:aminopeptidase [Herbaspirillum autotrophicum]|uniref:aminopeptidase n=1 Tax=Herbaspirillum autotrophicum TaxID=180195 RepID=UPI00067E1726|nr:aminopeptidase [Herbaspirillum autotrophicum]